MMRKKTYIQDRHLIYKKFDAHEDSWKIGYMTSGANYFANIHFLNEDLPRTSAELAKKVLSLHLQELSYGEETPVSEQFAGMAERLITLLSVAEKYYPGKKIAGLSQLELESSVALCVFHSTHINKKDNTSKLVPRQKPLASRALTEAITIFRIFYRFYHDGHVSDGPDSLVRKPEVKKVLQCDLSSQEIDMHSWEQGGSYGSIPFVVANLLLADAINLLQSEGARQLKAYFLEMRKPGNLIFRTALWVPYQNKINQYRKTSEIDLVTKTFGGDCPLSALCKTKLIIPLHHALQNISGLDFCFPWKNYTNVVRTFNEIRSACYIIFLSVMGKRGPSEILTLRASDVNIAKRHLGTSTVSAANHKSNQGVRTEHGVTDFVTLAYDTLTTLSYVPIADTDSPLFTTLPSLGNKHCISKKVSNGHASLLLGEYYEHFIARTASKVDFNLSATHPSLGSHQFRHTFAEFALRRFDGNVEELLRQAFMHGVNYEWIKNYTADKLDEENAQTLNREYIKELVPRILRDHPSLEPDFVGGMAVYIKSVIQPRTKHLAPKEFDLFIDSFSQEFINITPHEYGWCMLLKDFSSQAKCTEDGVTPSPKATCSSKCNGCINFVSSRSSHLTTQKMIAMTHIDFIECDLWKNSALRQASIHAVRDAQKLFPELKNLGVF